MMNILIFTQYFWPEHFHINDIAKNLLSKNHFVDVLTGKPNYPEGIFYKGYSAFGFSQEDYSGVNVYRLPIFARGKNNRFRLAINYFSFLISSILFAPFLLRRRKYDLVFVYGVSPIFKVISATLIAKIKGAPLVLWVQDLWPDSVRATGHIKSEFLIKIIEKLVRFSYSRADLILVQSPSFVAEVMKYAPGKKILYHPNSVSDDFYTPLNLPEAKIQSLDSGFNILFAGNIGAAQAFETIIDTAKYLEPYNEIKIVIIGNGSKFQWLRSKIEASNIQNIKLEGRYPVEKMPSIMRKASALLVSLRDERIFNITIPNKLQAYLAIGKPIIASLNGEGATLTIKAKAGFAVPAGDAEALSKAIITLYKMTEEERFQMGENARIYFKRNFNQEILTDLLLGYFKDIVYEWNKSK